MEATNCTNSELSTYLLELAAGCLPTSCSGTSRSEQSKSTPIAAKSYMQGNKTEHYRGFPSLMMSPPLTEGDTGDSPTSLPAGSRSRARTSHAPEREQESAAPDLGFGGRWRELSVKYDRDMSSWRTHLCLFDEALPWSSVTLPRWGMMRDGVCWEASMCISLFCGSGYGYLPAPMAADGTTAGGLARQKNGRCWNLRDWYHQVMGGTVGTPARRRNARFWEWLMGWPDNWTASTPLATDRVRQWLHLHGRC